MLFPLSILLWMTVVRTKFIFDGFTAKVLGISNLLHHEMMAIFWGSKIG